MKNGRGEVLHQVGRRMPISCAVICLRGLFFWLCKIAKKEATFWVNLSILNKKQKLKPYLSKIETKTIVFLCAIMMMHNRLAKGLLK